MTTTGRQSESFADDILSDRRKEGKTPAYRYRTTVQKCHLCGREQKFRERVHSDEPLTAITEDILCNDCYW